MRRALVLVATSVIACGAQPAAPPETARPAPVATVPPPAPVPEVEAAAAPDPNVIDVTLHSIRGNQSGHTAALHELMPTAGFAIIVHAPATNDARFFQQQSTLDVLFHPHDPAPDVLYAVSLPSRPLSDPHGRFAHQVDAADSEALQASFGDFAVLVLKPDGRLLGAFSEPAGRRELQELMGYRDRKGPPAPPHATGKP